MHGVGLEGKVELSHVNGPGKLIPLSLVINFIQWHLHVLAPTKQETGENVQYILTIFNAQ